MIQTRLVVDASVATKWLVPEHGSIEARRLNDRFELLAPDLIHAECANIVWKKVRRGNIPFASAVSVIETLTRLEVQIFSQGELAAAAMEISIKLDHPAYDCFYLALAVIENCRLVTADESLIRIIGQKAGRDLLPHCVRLQGFSD